MCYYLNVQFQGQRVNIHSTQPLVQLFYNPARKIRHWLRYVRIKQTSSHFEKDLKSAHSSTYKPSNNVYSANTDNEWWQHSPVTKTNNLITSVKCTRIYGGADKSLARPGRKQATATKFFCNPLKKKKFVRLSVQPGLRGSNDIRVGRKMAPFQLFQSGRAKELINTHVNLLAVALNGTQQNKCLAG